MEENQALGELSRVLQKNNEERDRISRAKQLVVEEEKAFQSIDMVNQGMETLRSYNRYLDRLEQQVQDAQDRLDQLKPELEKEQKKVAEAAKRRRIVELLEEKQRARYNQELKKEERKELADVYSMQKASAAFLEDSEKTYEPESGIAKTGDEGDFESSPGDEEELRKEKPDYVSDYLRSIGMEPPPKRR